MAKRLMTRGDYETIKLLLSHGLSKTHVKEITGFGDSTVYRVQRAADFEEYREIASASHNVPVEKKTAEPQPAPAFTDERLLMRLADSMDYNNQLLNGILNKLTQLTDALL